MRVNFVSENLTTLTYNGYTYALNIKEGTKQRLCCTANDPDPIEAPDLYEASALDDAEWGAVYEVLATHE